MKAIVLPLRMDGSVVVLHCATGCNASWAVWHIFSMFAHGDSSQINLDRFKDLMNGYTSRVDTTCLKWVGDLLGSLHSKEKRQLIAICRNVKGRGESTGGTCSLQ